MGKIFDALEKSKKKHSNSIAANQTPDNGVNGLPEKQDASFAWPEIFYNSNNIDKNLIALLNPQSFESEQSKL